MNRELLQQALDALTKCKAFSDYDPAVIYSDMISDIVSAIEALKEELAKPEPRTEEFVEDSEGPPCKTHPDAPHGYLRNASINAGRLVCECEFWSPGDAS